jgi:hypothetical protein
MVQSRHKDDDGDLHEQILRIEAYIEEVHLLIETETVEQAGRYASRAPSRSAASSLGRAPAVRGRPTVCKHACKLGLEGHGLGGVSSYGPAGSSADGNLPWWRAVSSVLRFQHSSTPPDGVLLILSVEVAGRLSNAQDMLLLGHHFDGRQRYV